MENTVQNAAPAATHSSLGDRFLLFHIGDAVYGLPLTVVLEIINVQKITFLPSVASYIKGIVNLRGKVVPAVDLRLKFGMEERAYDNDTCMVVLEMDGARIGLIVDSVQEVTKISARHRSAPPAGSKYLANVAQRTDDIVMLLDYKSLFEADLPQAEE